MFQNYPNAGLEVDAVRDSFPVLRATILKEFVDRLTELNLYDENNHNYGEKRITINGNYFNYYSVDSEMKARGRKRHILWLNEPNPIHKPVIDQLLIRTSHKVIIDFNPSEPIGFQHWLYDDIQLRSKAKTIITTYKDNPYLSQRQREEIESYENKDPMFYQVFGKGQRAAGRKGQIYTHFQRVDHIPPGRYFYGLDFGKSNNVTALVKCHYEGDTLTAEELIYQTNLSSNEIVKLLKQHNVNTSDEIFADAAEPLIIREIREAGYNIKAAVKGPGSVNGGIDKLKSIRVNLTSASRNAWNEVSWYCWKLDDMERPTNEPIDLHNDFMDALRYACNKLNSPMKIKTTPMAMGTRFDL